MTALRDWIELDGVRYQVDRRSCKRGPSKPYVPITSIGDKSFTGGVPPFTAVGQRRWSAGFQQKYVLSEGDNAGFRTCVNVDPQWGDRVLLANGFNATIYDTTKTSFQISKVPFADLLFAYSTVSENIWYKSGSSAWAAVDTSAISWTTTDPTGFLSSCIGQISSTPCLLIGSDKGHVVKITVSGGTPTAAEVGRPADGSNNCFGGIYCMAVYDSVLHLGGQDDGGGAIMLTYNGTTAVTKFFVHELNGGTTLRTMIRRYVDSDQNPDQLHFTVDNSTTNGAKAWHFLYDGRTLRELRYWPDNYPEDVIEYDVVGAKGLLFSMKRFGSIWRFTGDYSEVLRLDTPEESYTSFLGGLTQYGRFIVTTRKDGTNGLSQLFWDGRGWWQGPAIGSSYSGDPASARSVGVYRNAIFMGHSATNAGKIIESDPSTFATSGVLVTSLHDGGYRNVQKEWLRVWAEHSPLAASETLAIAYLLDDNDEGVYSDSFTTTAYKDTANTTGTWDTANGLITVPGTAAKTYASKVAGSVSACAHIAYSGVHSAPTGLTPGSLIAALSEMSQAQYDGIETDDADTGQTTSTVGTVDQSATTSETTVSLTTSSWLGQVFQAGSSATLTAAEVMIRDTDGDATVRLELYAVSAGKPTGAVLATSTARDDIGSSLAAHTFTFATPYTLTSGTSYALVVRPTVGEMSIRRSDSSVYANGTLVSTSNSGSSWSTDTTDLWFKTYISGTNGYPIQVFQFDVSGETIDTLLPRIIGYGSDSTGTANGGLTWYIWDVAGSVWESLGTNTAVAASADAAKTIAGSITSGASDYVDGNDKVHLLAVPTYAGTNALAGRLYTDFVRLDGAYTTSLKTVRSLDVDTVSTGNIPNATLTITGAANGATVALYMSVDGGSTWESCTSGAQKTFAGSGNQLRWRVDMTSVATARPEYTAITITYTLPAAYVTLVTNTQDGSTTTEAYFPDSVFSRLLNLKFTLVGPGTTTPQLYSYTLEYLPSPDVLESFACDLILQMGHVYSDLAAEETRTPAAQYAALLALKTGRRKPSFAWIDGTSKTQVTFPSGFWTAGLIGIPVDVDEEQEQRVPIVITTVKD